jgi:5,10-methylene-tetrahydrofolate dehydrogenase/methenyl tetrahydrofolate cyclohydrolase
MTIAMLLRNTVTAAKLTLERAGAGQPVSNQ